MKKFYLIEAMQYGALPFERCVLLFKDKLFKVLNRIFNINIIITISYTTCDY